METNEQYDAVLAYAKYANSRIHHWEEILKELNQELRFLEQCL
jgi:hypothetical protein